MKKQEEIFNTIIRCLSEARLRPYSPKPSEEISRAISRYLWNIALSESLYPSISFLEVALRNELYNKLGSQFGKDWLMNDGRDFLDKTEQAKIMQAKERLKRDKKPISSGRLVPELHLGFWNSLLNSKYELPVWRKLFSVKSDEKIFPMLPKQNRKRRVLSTRFNELRNLRNRIFHHEPIWYWKDLARTHSNILEAISWINPELRSLAQHNDRFLDILMNGQQYYAELIDLYVQNLQ